MNARTVLLSSALLAPALLLASCNEVKDTPAEPSTPGIAPTTTQTPSAVRLNPRKVRIPKPSAAELAAAMREDEVNAPATVTPTLTGDLSPHDPTRAGQRLICLDGDEGAGAGFNGEATRFRNDMGCELNAIDGDLNPNNNAAFAVPVQNRISGKRLTAIQRLDFFYAGGPAIGGNPRLSIPIDEDGDGDFEPFPNLADEQFAFIDALGCNNGDPHVGRVFGDDDPTCNVNYKSINYPNFSSFEAAFPNARIARNSEAVTFIAVDQPVHYLIYRVNIR
jgi:hypothetical protein